MLCDTTRARKKRSKTGCFTCRQRKVRCDEQHPRCRACRRLGLACSFPPPRPADHHLPQSPQPRRKQQHEWPSNRPSNAASFASNSQSSTLQPTPSLDDGGGSATQQSSFSWWSSLGEGLLDLNWLEHWVPEEEDIFDDFGLGSGIFQPQARRTPSPSQPARYCRDVTLLPQDREALQHFTTTMVRFCILRNCVHDNLYSYILINMGLFHSTLFDAMMAWSSLHLAHVLKRSNRDARRRYDRAYTALIEDLGNDVSPSLLLATIWFLVQYQLILAEGVEGFCELIGLAAEVARSELQNTDAETSMSRIGPIGSLILVWMSARDSQAACLGLGGKLLGCLKTYPHIYELVDTSSLSNESDETPDIVFMEREQISKRQEPSEMQNCMRLSFKSVTVAGQIKFLGRSQLQPVESSAWHTIRGSLGVLRREIEQDDTLAARAALGVATGNVAAMRVVNPINYNRLLLLAGYYTTLLQYHMYRPCAVHEPELLSPEECADRIIRLCQRVETERPESPQGVWPTHILLAGITTRDPVYQAWAIHAFEKAERWGAHIVKTRRLLEAVVRRQNSTGERADLIQVMKETTGFFIF